MKYVKYSTAPLFTDLKTIKHFDSKSVLYLKEAEKVAIECNGSIVMRSYCPGSYIVSDGKDKYIFGQVKETNPLKYRPPGQIFKEFKDFERFRILFAVAKMQPNKEVYIRQSGGMRGHAYYFNRGRTHVK